MSTNILYIVSSGHSGSTLLDILAGSLPDVFSTGELVYMPWQAWRDGKTCPNKEDLCTCLKPLKECEVWSEVFRRLNKDLSFDIFEDPMRFRLAVVKDPAHGVRSKWRKAWRKKRIEHLDNNSLWNMLTGIVPGASQEAVANNWKLADTFGELYGTKFLVDSSKDPLRLHYLNQMHPERMKTLVLIRDVHGVANSAKNRGENLEESAHRWLNHYNNKIKPVLNKMDPADYMLVRYEELAQDPQAIRNEIAAFLGIENPGPLPVMNPQKDYHLVAGNKMRYRGEVKIRYDSKWQRQLNEKEISMLDAVYSKIDPFFQRLPQTVS
ncbi:MAG: sulfotransferase [Bacteroidota bacterium]